KLRDAGERLQLGVGGELVALLFQVVEIADGQRRRGVLGHEVEDSRGGRGRTAQPQRHDNQQARSSVHRSPSSLRAAQNACRGPRRVRQQESLPCHAGFYFSAASDAQTSSLSLRAKTHLLAKAGWLQTTLRPKPSLVGSSSLQRLISS